MWSKKKKIFFLFAPKGELMFFEMTSEMKKRRVTLYKNSISKQKWFGKNPILKVL